VVIGRAHTATVRIDHGSVSREHAALHLGSTIRLEDLGSSNGTRVRDVPLAPGVQVEVFPDDVIDLGAVLLVLQYRRPGQRLRRVCHPAMLEICVEEECARASTPFAVARLDVEGGLSPHAVQLLLASALRDDDLLAVRAPGTYEVLLREASPQEAETRIEAAAKQLALREVRVRTSLACSPRDGRDAARLLGRSTPPGRVNAAAPAIPDAAADCGLVVRDPSMVRVVRLLERVADSHLSVLLLGETGAGKEVCAELLHRLSPRAAGPMVRVNCAALPESLIDSELFGHERGAFTGAVADKPGLLESGSGGTVFLDEIGDMPLSTQVKLLRVLESKESTRVGSVKARPIDVRIVAATNRDLHEAITAGRFREDLFYRLNGISIVVPPLRERPEDIGPLAQHFAERATKPGRTPPALAPESLNWLVAQRWRGNVRELRNVIERATILCEGGTIEAQNLRGDGSGRRSRTSIPPPPAGLRDEVKALERERIERALDACGGNQRRAADELGISRGALLRRLAQHGFRRPRGG
jgi:DNA-binding NtrC family response regulator